MKCKLKGLIILNLTIYCKFRFDAILVKFQLSLLTKIEELDFDSLARPNKMEYIGYLINILSVTPQISKLCAKICEI